jgi:hypothetical protein
MIWHEALHTGFLSAQSYLKVNCESRKTKIADSDFALLAWESSVLCGGCATLLHVLLYVTRSNCKVGGGICHL